MKRTKKLWFYLIAMIFFVLSVSRVQSKKVDAATTVYDIEFRGNGATSGTTKPMRNCKYTKTYKLNANGYKKTGFTFVGWCRKADGSGKIYKNTQSVKKLQKKNHGKVVLYAQWRANDYTIIYDGNGATSGSMASKACKYNKRYALRNNQYEREGYVFTGWSRKPDGTGTTYANKEIVKGLQKKDKGTVTLYAQWKIIEYTIVFDGNGYTAGRTDRMTGCKYAQTYTLRKNAFGRAGYRFLGWNTQKDGSGVSYDNKAKFSTTAIKDGDVITLYAQWRENKWDESPIEFHARYMSDNGVSFANNNFRLSDRFTMNRSDRFFVPTCYTYKVFRYEKGIYDSASNWKTGTYTQTKTEENVSYRILVKTAGGYDTPISFFELLVDAPSMQVPSACDLEKTSMNRVETGMENMIWTWWYYPQVVSLKKTEDKVYWGFTTKEGNSGVAEYDNRTGLVKKNILKQSVADDHNTMAVTTLPDGRIMCAYSGGHNEDRRIHLRKSVNPESVESFEEEITIEASDVTTYCQILRCNGTYFLFYRLGNKNWAFRSTKDWKTWTDEVILVHANEQYYCKFMPTTQANRIRIVMYANPGGVDTSIRMGFLDTETLQLLNADNMTVLGQDYIFNTEFTTLIEREQSKSQRLFDVAITAPLEPRILYATFQGAYDSIYYLYDTNKSVMLCQGGRALWEPKSQLGASFLGTDRIILSREENRTDYVELYSYRDGIFNKVEELASAPLGATLSRLARPIVDVNGKVVLWHEGYYNPKSYKIFNTNAVLKSLE